MSPALAVRGTGKFGWGSPLPSGDLRFITSAAGSAVASLSVDNCFSADYDHYLIMKNLLGSAGGAPYRVRLRVGGADASGANYRYQTLLATGSSTSGSRTTGDTQWNEPMGYTETTAFAFGRLWISNPFAAVRTTAWTAYTYGFYAGVNYLATQMYEHDLATSYDGFTVYPSTGTLTGSIYVYGLAV